MRPALKAIVLTGAVLFGYGVWTLIKAALSRLGRRKWDANPPAPGTSGERSSHDRGHPVAWAFVVGLGLLLALALAFARGLAELGGKPATAEDWEYLTGAVIGPFVLAGIGVGIYYAFRKSRRTPRRVISAFVGWTLLVCILALPGPMERWARSPYFPRDEKEIGRMMSQAYKEASGAVPRDQYSKDEVVASLREIFADSIQFEQQYEEAMTQFSTPEMRRLYAASSFGDRKGIEETIRQLRNMASVEQQLSSFDSVFAKMEAHIQQRDWPAGAKHSFIAGMRTSFQQTKRSRLATYEIKRKWIDASLDLYSFALNNLPAISVHQNQMVISEAATREAFNKKLEYAVGLRQQALEASRQYDRERATNAQKYGLSPADLGLK
jgi:hypothetical protein